METLTRLLLIAFLWNSWFLKCLSSQVSPSSQLLTGNLLPSVTQKDVKKESTARPSDLDSTHQSFIFIEKMSPSLTVKQVIPTRAVFSAEYISPSPSLPLTQSSNSAIPASSNAIMSMQVSCPRERDRAFGILWPRTKRKRERLVPCPQSFTGIAKRFCRPNGRWRKPDFSHCQATSIEGLDATANLLFNSDEANIEDAKQFVKQLRNLTRPPPRNRRRQRSFLNRNNLRTINFVTRRALRLLRLQTNSSIDSSEIFGLFNNALDSRNRDSWEDLQQIEPGSEELLKNAESFAGLIASRLKQQGENVRYSKENLVLKAERPFLNDGFRDNQFPSVEDLVNSSVVNSSIKIPSKYLSSVAGSDEDVSIAFMLFLTLQDFLPYGATQENTTVASTVILSAQVISSNKESNKNFSILSESPIELIFSIKPSYNASTENTSVQCVYWNFTTDLNETSSGGWASEGIVTEIINESTVRCLSQHLTSFAVLVDVEGTYSETNAHDSNNSNAEEIHEVALSAVSYVGCAISIICLLITVVFLCSLREAILNEVHNLLHLNLAISLLLGLIVFVCGIEYAADYKIACTIVALLLHYFFLSAFCWMFCEAMVLYLLIVVVFSRMAKKWYLFLLIGWGTPLIIVSISFGASFGNYIKDSSICWLNYSNYVIWSFTGPMCLIIIVNSILLSIVVMQLYRTRKHRHYQTGTGLGLQCTKPEHLQETRKTAIYLTKAIAILLPLLGITWVVGIFTLNEYTLFFAWLFTILNTSQGMFFFIFHVVCSQRFLRAIGVCYTAKRHMIPQKNASSNTQKSLESLDSLENTTSGKQNFSNSPSLSQV